MSVLLLALLAVFVPAAVCASCFGDCDGSGGVGFDDLLIAIDIVLEQRPSIACSAAVVDGVEDVVAISNAATKGCATPTPTATPTAMATPLPAEWQEAFPASLYGWMLNAWGSGDGSIYAVGGTEARGRVLHGSGTTWNEVDLGVSVPLLNWVHGLSPHNIFIGGVNGTVVHFDGVTWAVQATPTTLPIWGIWAVASNDVWAVGGDAASTKAPVVLHYDGNAWSSFAIPTLVRPRVYAFFKVWASGPSDVYVVGQSGAVLHYDGSRFTELFVGASDDLIGVWGTGPDDVMIVGGRGSAELVHFDGITWQHAQSGLPGLSGVWMRRSDVAHAVGEVGTVVRIDPRTLETTQETAIPTQLDLHSIFGDPSGQLITVGANFVTPERGAALVRGLSDED